MDNLDEFESVAVAPCKFVFLLRSLSGHDVAFVDCQARRLTLEPIYSFTVDTPCTKTFSTQPTSASNAWEALFSYRSGVLPLAPSAKASTAT